MSLNSLLLSSDEKTVRILRRVLSDLEIGVEHCSTAEDAIRLISRQRFEAIIVDGANTKDAGNVLLGAKASAVNQRALAIMLVEASTGLKGGFEMGAHFILHKPFAVERAKSSFRAVRALMKRERRLQMRVAVEIPVACFGAASYTAKTIDLCEGGMAIQFTGRVAMESPLRFSLDLPGMEQSFETEGELAWKGSGGQAGVRFTDVNDKDRDILRQWLQKQLPELEEDDPAVNCRLTDLSCGGCYLTTNSPFPRGTRVTLSINAAGVKTHAAGIVLVAHPEFGMGVEFLQATTEHRDRALRLITALRANEDKSPELQVEPDGLDTSSPEDGMVAVQASATGSASEDGLLDLFRCQFQAPVETFMRHMREQRQPTPAISD